MDIHNTKFEKLWTLIGIPDEAIIHQMEVSLRRVGVYNLDDLAFLIPKDVVFPSMVKPVFIRKFGTVCEFYAQGHRLKEDSTMQDVLQALNSAPIPPQSPAHSKLQQSPKSRDMQSEMPVAQAVPISGPVVSEDTSSTPNTHLNVVIIGDCAQYKRGWHHLEQFSKIEKCRVHSVINIGTTDESLTSHCQKKNILLVEKIEHLSVPQPNLYVIGPSRNHDLFKLLDMDLPPSCVMLDLPGTITVKALDALSNFAADNDCPLYMNCSRVVAPYVQQTLEAATAQSTLRVGWYHRQDIPMTRMAEAFSKGRIFHTTAFPDLVVAVMYFGVTVESISRFQLNPGMTNYQTINGITDYVRAAFMMTTHSGVELSVIADRNAPTASCLGVVINDQGDVINQFDHLHSHCDLKLKRRLVRSLMENTNEILPSVRIGVEALRLAEYVGKHFEKNLKDMQPADKSGLWRRLSNRLQQNQ
mmetsp:Transcript_24754/g.37621  ORF Transcript_24754/g.37621 Transcript_24754/m.37621 type:complete len:471 (-) Transcript_24754:700-2112(-)